MKKIIALIILPISMIILNSCSLFDEDIEASGLTVTEDFDLSDVTGLSVADGLSVTIKQSPNNILKLETDSAYRPYINIKNDKGLIKVYKDKDISFSEEGLTSIVVYKDKFQNINITGGSNVMSDMLKGDEISISVSGGSYLESLISSLDLDLILGGGSEVLLKGNVETLTLESTGGAKLEAEELEVRNAEIVLAGGSETKIHVTDSLNVKATGGSELYYEGEPKHITQNASGGSVIEKD